MAEAAVGPVAFRTAQAQPALAQPGNVLGGDGGIGQQAGQQQVKNRSLGVHHTAGQAAHGYPVQIADQEHGTRQHRRAVADDVGAGVFDGQRGAVVGVHAHAAGGEDQFAARRLCFQNGRCDARRVVVAGTFAGWIYGNNRFLQKMRQN